MTVASDISVSRAQLRTFHWTGLGLEPLLSDAPLRPVLLESIELPRFEQNYPLYVAESQTPRPLFRILRGVLDAAFPILRDNLELIAGAFEEHIGPRGYASVSSIVDEALATVCRRIESVKVDPRAVESERAALKKVLPGEGWLIAFGTHTTVLLSLVLLESARRKARLAFGQQLKEASQRIQELLALDNRTASVESVAASLGAGAASLLDVSALVDALRRRANPVPAMDPERRARCESALVTIQDASQRLNRMPSIILVHRGSAPEVPPQIAIQFREVSDPCDSALSLCGRQIDGYVEVWKALRIAALEVDSAFDPSVHEDALNAFNSSMAHPSELAVLPVVVAAETAEGIGQYLASFARVLQSRLPVQVLVVDPNVPGANLGCVPFPYQEAFALQSSIGAPDHLIGGILEMAQTLRPAAAFVSVSKAWTTASLLLLAQATPLWRYHPDGGESWRECFAMETGSSTPNEQLTFAHIAALMPGYQTQFRMLPVETESVDESSLVEFPRDLTPHALPFLHVTDQNGRRRRAVFTRELVRLCSAAERRRRFLTDMSPPVVCKKTVPDTGSNARAEGAKQAILRVIEILSKREHLL